MPESGPGRDDKKKLLLALLLGLPVNAFADNAPGLVERETLAPHHQRQMQMAVWYPAEAGEVSLFAGNAVFKDGEVRREAAPASGKHPLILLSHDMGGPYLSINWLASGLAAKGAVVLRCSLR